MVFSFEKFQVKPAVFRSDLIFPMVSTRSEASRAFLTSTDCGRAPHCCMASTSGPGPNSSSQRHGSDSVKRSSAGLTAPARRARAAANVFGKGFWTECAAAGGAGVQRVGVVLLEHDVIEGLNVFCGLGQFSHKLWGYCRCGPPLPGWLLCFLHQQCHWPQSHGGQPGTAVHEQPAMYTKHMCIPLKAASMD